MAGMLLMGMYWYVFLSDGFLRVVRTRVSRRIASPETSFQNSDPRPQEAMLTPLCS